MITCDIMSFTFYASLPASAWAGVLTIAQVITVALAAGSVSVLFTTACPPERPMSQPGAAAPS
jgi:hypothetical protein